METRPVQLTSQERGFIVIVLEVAEEELNRQWKRDCETPPPPFQTSYDYIMKASGINLAMEALMDAEDLCRELGGDEAHIPVGILDVIGINLERYARDEFDAAAIAWHAREVGEQQAAEWRAEGKAKAKELAHRLR